jgi:hypothetical protein
MRPILALSQLVFALGLPEAMAAQGPPLKLGDRIRVTVPSLGVKPFVGIVERVPADTILVRTSPEVLSAFPLDQVARLELSRGTGSPTWALFAPLWMPLAGGAVGFALGAAKPGSREDPATAGLIIGVMGAVVGLVAGVVTVFVVDLREEWATVPTRRGSRTSLAPSLYVAPAARGLTLGLRAAF